MSRTGNLKLPALNAAEELGVGFFAGIASRAVSSPLSMVTVRLQSSDDEDESDNKDELERGPEEEGPKSKKTVGRVVDDIYSEDGVSGFWTGVWN
jgi:hypothetical protein